MNLAEQQLEGDCEPLRTMLESTINLSTTQPLETLLDVCVDLLFGGSLPQTQSSSVCAKIWGPGFLAYRCRECQVTPNSCICVDCFSEGNHEGHDCHLYTSAYGGCCDCGDSTAWRPSGFCKHHCARQESGGFTPLADSVLPVLFDLLCKHLLNMGTTEKNLLLLLSRLDQLCSYGDATRGKLAQIAAKLSFLPKEPNGLPEPFVKDPCVIVMLLCGMCYARTSAISDSVTKLLMNLFYDLDFKYHFASKFIQNYRMFYSETFSAQKRSQINEMLTTTTAQIFNMETLVDDLVTKDDLLQILINLSLELLQRHSVVKKPSGNVVKPETVRRIVDTKLNLMERGSSAFPRIYSDLEQSLKFRKAVDVLVFTESLWDKFLSFLSYYQGIGENVNVKGEHVEYETGEWRNAFIFDLEIIGIITTTMNQLPHLIYGYTALERPAFLAEVHRLTSSCLNAILSCFSCDGLGWKLLRLPHIGMVECLDSGVSLDRALTLHIPLSRVLPFVIGQVMRCLNAPPVFSVDDNVFWDKREVTLRELLPESIGDRDIMATFLDGPLHSWLLCAQVAAGMWNKNGMATMEGQRGFYQSSFMFGDGLEVDILALQSGVVLLGAEHFIHMVLESFDLRNWFVLDSRPVDTEKKKALAEECLALLTTVLTNRTMTSTEDSVRRQLIHWLAVENLPHSKLVKKLKYRSDSDPTFTAKQLETTLAAVAITLLAQSGKPILYQLKPECWVEFDPYFPHYTKADFNKAEENYQLFTKKKGDMLPVRTPCEPFAPYASLKDALRTDAVFALIFCILYNSNRKNEDRSSFKLLDTALHLLQLIVKMPPSTPPPPSESAYETDFEQRKISQLNDIIFARVEAGADLLKTRLTQHFLVPSSGDDGHDMPVSILDLLIELKKKEEFKDRHHIFQQLLTSLADHDESIRQIIDVSLPEVGGSKQSARELAKQRILNQLAQARGSFQQSFFAGEDMDVDDEEEEEMEGGDLGHGAKKRIFLNKGYDTAECVLCREKASADNVSVNYNNPMGIIALFKRNRIPAIIAEQQRARDAAQKLQSVVSKEENEKEDKGKEKEKEKDHPSIQQQGVKQDDPETIALLSEFLNRDPNLQLDSLEGIADVDPSMLGFLMNLLAARRASEASAAAYADAAAEATEGEELVAEISALPADVKRKLLRGTMQVCVDVKICGHVVHTKCLKDFLAVKSRSVSLTPEELSLNRPMREFYCPQCRQLSNILVPLIPIEQFCLATPQDAPDASMRDASCRESKFLGWLQHFVDTSEMPLNVIEEAALLAEIEAPAVEDVQMAERTLSQEGLASSPPAPSRVQIEDVQEGEEEEEEEEEETVVESPSRELTEREKHQKVVHTLEVFERQMNIIVCYQFAQTAHAHRSTIELACSLLNAFVTNLAITEIALRSSTLDDTKFFQVLSRPAKLSLPDFFVSVFTLLATKVSKGVISQWNGFIVDILSGKEAQSTQLRLFDSVNMTALFVKFVLLQKVNLYLELRERVDAENASDKGMRRGINYERMLAMDDYLLFAMRLFYSATVEQALAHLATIQPTAEDLTDGSNRRSFVKQNLSALQGLCLPFLRTIAFFVRTCLGGDALTAMPISSNTSLQEKMHQEFMLLSEYLNLQPINRFFCLPSSIEETEEDLLIDSCLLRIASRWNAFTKEGRKSDQEEGDVQEEIEKRGRQEVFPLLESGIYPGYVPFALVELAATFQEIFHRYLGRKCENCQAEARYPAICLLCSSFVSANCTCREDEGQCFLHMITCGAGSGIFLLTRDSSIVLASDERLCRWGSVYLDSFGEEDLGFQRGKKLTLEPSLQEHLRGMYVEDLVDKEILRGDVSYIKRPHSSRKW